MSTAGNLLWFILGGFLIAILYLVGSLILMLTIIGIPFGIQTLKMTALALAPFGREVDRTESAAGCLNIVMNIIWVLVAGVELAILHLILALFFAITIIGIPFAKQHVKMAYLALVPLWHGNSRLGKCESTPSYLFFSSLATHSRYRRNASTCQTVSLTLRANILIV